MPTPRSERSWTAFAPRTRSTRRSWSSRPTTASRSASMASARTASSPTMTPHCASARHLGANRLRAGLFGDTMRLVDVVPTMLDLLGASPLANVDNRSVAPLRAAAPADDPRHFEALNANFTRNWAPLKGILSRRRKLIDLPIPELYDLAVDPGEEHNLYAPRHAHTRSPRRGSIRSPRLHRPSSPSAPIDAPTPKRDCAPSATWSRRRHTRGRPTVRPTIGQLKVHLNTALDDAAAAFCAGGRRHRRAFTLTGIVRERPDFMVASSAAQARQGAR